MKKRNYIPYLISTCVLIWLWLFLSRTFLVQTPSAISKLAAQFEFIVHFFVLYGIYKVFKQISQNERAIFKWFVIINVGLLFNDLAWYSITYLNNPDVLHISTIPFLLNLIPFYVWVIASIVFLGTLLKQYILQITRRKKTLFTFALINIAISVLFLSSIHYTITIQSLSALPHILTFLAQLVLYDFVILCLVYTDSTGLTLFLLGIILMMAADFFLDYAIIAHVDIISTYGELLWFLGLLFNWFGILFIQHEKDYIIKKWVRKDTAIKSQFAFWYFSMAVGSFLLFFIVAYIFSIISRVEFLGLHIFVMMYSAIVIIASGYISKYLEEPFKKIEHNIQLLLNNSSNPQIDNNFSTDEFIFLQQFIVNAFKEAAQKQAEIAEQLKQMAHDMASPIQSINTIISHVSGSIPEQYRVTLRNASERISGIAQKLISKYSSDGTDNDEVLLVSLAIMQLINEKREEYINSSNIELVVDIRLGGYFACIQMSAGNFKRMLSNLINNAYDALRDKTDSSSKIEVRISAPGDDYVVVVVKDNGPGMPEHIQQKFMDGIPVTEGKGDAGHGLGLSQVKDAITAAQGEIAVAAGPDYGTMINISFPRVSNPGWLATEIKLTGNDTVMILDDDDSIHGAWDSTFEQILAKAPNLKIEHFWQGQDAIDYIRQLSENAKDNTFLLTDYELIDQPVNGIDVVAQSNITRAVLVTSYATNPARQKEVMQLGIRMLPKELSAAIKISVDKKLAKGSRKVDMVWIDDQADYLKNTVANFYSHLTVDQYNDPVSLLEDIAQYPLDTRIILDTYYEPQYLEDGLSLGRKLHELGYKQLILYTGEKSIDVPDYLTVISKFGHTHRGDQALDKIPTKLTI